ncbi:Crp/Fnr family transcriptional regulator [uncultured Bradyrhizobium sp.]|uniref:Crp/Fnr family transcriptional regulator n=1 Tax=uncultured Bradyrhizobium sp. TaxID=199684 RepID=UPI0035CA1D69
MIRTTAPNLTRLGRCSACAVRSLSICGALDQADLAGFERIARHVHLAPNEALFSAGQTASSVHTLTAGVARLYKLLPDGRRQVIGFALPGDFLGTAPSDRYSYSADAVDSVSVCRLSVEAFSQFIEQRPHFLLRINEFACRELTIAQEQMLLLGRRNAEEKVAAFLVNWRDRQAQAGDERQTITLPMSRQDIADYLGLTIETVSRTLTRFEREKLLIIIPGGVRLLDSTRAGAIAAA